MRQEKDECYKLERIEMELTNSVDLKSVSKPIDTIDFESITNKEFNRNFQAELESTKNNYKPILRSRSSRRTEAMKFNS